MATSPESTGPDSRKRVYVETIEEGTFDTITPAAKQPRLGVISLEVIADKVDREAIRAECKQEIPEEDWDSPDFEALFVKKWTVAVRRLFDPIAAGLVKDAILNKDGYMGCKILHVPSKYENYVLSGFGLNSKYGPSAFKEKDEPKKAAEKKKDPSITFAFEYPPGSVNQIFDDALFQAAVDVVLSKMTLETLGLTKDAERTRENVIDRFSGGDSLYVRAGMNKGGKYVGDTAHFTTPFKAEFFPGTNTLDPKCLRGLRIYEGEIKRVTTEDGSVKKIVELTPSTAEELCSFYKYDEETRSYPDEVPTYRTLWRVLQITGVPGPKQWSIKRQVDSITFFRPTGEVSVPQDPGLNVDISHFSDGFIPE